MLQTATQHAHTPCTAVPGVGPSIEEGLRSVVSLPTPQPHREDGEIQPTPHTMTRARTDRCLTKKGLSEGRERTDPSWQAVKAEPRRVKRLS